MLQPCLDHMVFTATAAVVHGNRHRNNMAVFLEFSYIKQAMD